MHRSELMYVSLDNHPEFCDKYLYIFNNYWLGSFKDLGPISKVYVRTMPYKQLGTLKHQMHFTRTRIHTHTHTHTYTHTHIYTHIHTHT